MSLIIALCGVEIGSLQSAREFSVSAQSISEEIRVNPASDPDPRNTTSIAVSPTNNRIIVGASKVALGAGSGGLSSTRVAYYHSSDAGMTWQTSLLGLETPQKTWSRATDPAVAADLNGNFYLSVLMLDNSTFDTGVYLFKSTDGGQTFGNPLTVFVDIGNLTNPRLADKSYLTVDASPSSPMKNSVYVAWTITEIGAQGRNQATINMAYLRPGSNNFSAPRTISHGGDMRGPSVTTGPNGEFYAAWEGIGSPRVILFNASTDGGDTFLPIDVAPSIDLNIHSFVGSLSQPAPVINITGVSRMNCFPVIDVDRSSGPNRGMIYVAWAESSNRADSDIFIKRLTPPNGGRPDISPPVRVNSVSLPGDQFFPWLSVDPSDGRVDVAFYGRNDINGLLISAYLARSVDGAASFEEHQISSAAFDPRIQAGVIAGPGASIGIGDYIGLKAEGGQSHLLWTDTRNGKQEIFYGGILSPGDGGGTGDDAPVNDECQNAKTIGALPFTDSLMTDTATSSSDDPSTCASGQSSHSVWYRFTAGVNTVYGVDTLASSYDTVLSVYTGNCGSLTRIACNDNFSNTSNRSLLTFAATAGQTYLIEVSGKTSGGAMTLRFGHPTITRIEFTKAPDKSKSLKITGAGFINGDTKVIIQDLNQVEAELEMTFYAGDHQGDGTVTVVFGTQKKLKKMVKVGRTIIVTARTPAAVSGNRSNSFSFTRQ